MRTELIHIPTDSHPLDGVYYAPDGGPSRGAVLLMHGNTMNFYTGASRFLPPALTAVGYECLSFNRRGHEILTTRNSREPVGGAFQTAAEALADNEYAADYLAERGFGSPIPIGHSTGGVLAAAFAARHNETPALVLLSAHRGGTDSAAIDRRAGLLGADRHQEIRDRAETLVAAGRGWELMQVPGWWYVISAQSYLDRLASWPDLLDEARRVRCPTLFVRGEREPAHAYPAEEFQRACPARCDVAIIAAADHFYNGAEEAVAEAITGWLASTCTYS